MPWTPLPEPAGVWSVDDDTGTAFQLDAFQTPDAFQGTLAPQWSILAEPAGGWSKISEPAGSWTPLPEPPGVWTPVP